ncbi:uncharacterized protein A4U43_UnF1630 [Asparagus officinalis]|uniref:Uncharacterized protein n=1 Tax=Asparagus officinalis TaxID=4686 RepID=A0A1R3L7I9_ASPOF|nr:uncharacterized protein A4U43_UnF1630 [Asparagus officinalis]
MDRLRQPSPPPSSIPSPHLDLLLHHHRSPLVAVQSPTEVQEPDPGHLPLCRGISLPHPRAPPRGDVEVEEMVCRGISLPHPRAPPRGDVEVEEMAEMVLDGVKNVREKGKKVKDMDWGREDITEDALMYATRVAYFAFEIGKKCLDLITRKS